MSSRDPSIDASSSNQSINLSLKKKVTHAPLKHPRVIDVGDCEKKPSARRNGPHRLTD